MSIIQSFILGIIQGLTEFIPVSSSGHLVIIPEIFGWEQQPTSFDIIIHSATLLALLVYFYQDIKSLILNIRKKKQQKLLLNLIIITIPAGLVGLLFENFIDKNFKDVQVIIVMLIVFGIIFILTEKLFLENTKKIEKLTPFSALLIGLGQTLSLIRGTSRSGITILGGLFQGLSRQEAARISFLAGILIVGAATLKQFVGFSSSGLGTLGPGSIIVGFTAAFISGLISIRFMLSFLKSNGLVVFGIYRIILGLLIWFLLCF